jgi:hypothetical protein
VWYNVIVLREKPGQEEGQKMKVWMVWYRREALAQEGLWGVYGNAEKAEKAAEMVLREGYGEDARIVEEEVL